MSQRNGSGVKLGQMAGYFLRVPIAAAHCGKKRLGQMGSILNKGVEGLDGELARRAAKPHMAQQPAMGRQVGVQTERFAVFLGENAW